MSISAEHLRTLESLGGFPIAENPGTEINALISQRIPGHRRQELQYPFPANVPTKPQQFGEGPYYPTPQDSLWRRKNRHQEPEVYPMRLRDVPVWGVEAVIGSVSARAKNVAEHPDALRAIGGIPNYSRLKRAISQEAQEVLSSNRELLLSNWKDKVKTFFEHKAVHALSVILGSIGSAGTAVPLIGRSISTLLSIYRGAPEELPLNAVMFALDLGFAGAILATAASFPPAAFAIGAVDVLFNMYVNSSASRRYKEVNNKIIPHVYNILSFSRNPNQADSRRSIYARAFRKVEMGNPELLSRLESEESNLNPRDFTNPDNEKLRSKYTSSETDLKKVGEVLDALESMQYADEISQKFWQIGKRIMRWRRKGDIQALFYWFNKIDDEMYEKWDFPHHEAERLLDMKNTIDKIS